MSRFSMRVACRRLLLAVALCSVVLLGSLSPSLGAISPPSEDGAQWAYVQMQMVEISKIDGVEQAFYADFYMLTTWAANVTDTPFTGSSEEDLTSSDVNTYFWSPQLEFINQRDAMTLLVDEPYGFVDQPGFDLASLRPDYVLPPGFAWITEDQRYQCEFTTKLSMREFPFDSQFMQLVIESFWSEDQVIIRWAEPHLISKLVPSDVADNIVGWKFVSSSQVNSVQDYAYNGRDYDRLTIRTILERQAEYYLTKIVAGSMLLVYMCIYVFSLAVDEADRMMGTLQIFAGLITFLFVASGDTPKVPYQTRLDLFMLYSFFNVALMLFIHGTLYYWRECDVESELEHAEKRHQEEMAEKLRGVSGGEIELGMAGAPKSPAGRVYVNDPTPRAQPRAMGVADLEDGFDAPKNAYAAGPTPVTHPTSSRFTWRLRVDAWSNFSFRKWYRGLHLTRKIDAIMIPLLAVIYSIGCAVILGRPVDHVAV